MQPDQDLLDEVVHRILAVTQPLKIMLFGSAARGTMGPGSDIDLLVVVPDGTPRRQTAQIISMNLFGLERGVDVVVATAQDLQEYGEHGGLVYDPARREGREISVASPHEAGLGWGRARPSAA